jgi:hypothetical protein
MIGDVVDVLLGQHALIEEQFLAVSTASGKAARRRAFEELARLLVVHETIEQSLVHPAASESIDSGTEVTADRLAEEERADGMLREMFEIDVDDPDFPRLLAGLREAVLSHATREERYEFPRLRVAVPDERLAAAVRQAFDSAPATLPRADGVPAALDEVRAAVTEALT